MIWNKLFMFYDIVVVKIVISDKHYQFWAQPQASWQAARDKERRTESIFFSTKVGHTN